jgi:hypothetical protein
MRNAVILGLIMLSVPALAATPTLPPPPPLSGQVQAAVSLPAAPGAPSDLAPAYAPFSLAAVMLDSGQALLWDEASSRYRLAMVGEQLGAWKVVTIEAERVVVVSADVRDELRLAAAPRRIALAAAGKPTLPAAPDLLPAPPGVAPPPAAPVKPAGPVVDKRTVTRADVDRELGDFDRLGQELSIAPATGGGFTLTRLTPAAWLYQLGLREGDIVRNVGGVALNSVDDAARAYAKIRNAKKIEVQFDRPGASGNEARVLELEVTGTRARKP